MQVRMKVKISGTRNSEEWPDKGEVIDLPNDEAVQLLNQGAAEPLGEDDPETATAKAPAIALPEGAPKASVSKKDWVAFAIEKGVDAAEAESLTRDQLVERFAAEA